MKPSQTVLIPKHHSCKPALLGLVMATLFSVLPMHPVHAGEREDIISVLREIEYLRERVQALSKKYGRNQGKIRFNYLALLDQLRATENGIRAYLNAQIDVIHTQPPKPVDQQLYRVRKN